MGDACVEALAEFMKVLFAAKHSSTLRIVIREGVPPMVLAVMAMLKFLPPAHQPSPLPRQESRSQASLPSVGGLLLWFASAFTSMAASQGIKVRSGRGETLA